MAERATSPAPVRRVLVLGGLALVMQMIGLVPAGGAATSLLCVLLLICGLPHGALDLERLRLALRGGRMRFGALVVLYVGLAVLALTIWQVNSLLGLALFLLIAAAHFSEDWHAMDEPLLGLGMAAAMLAGPALLHRVALAEIFAAVTGSAASAALGELLLLVAPVAILIAAVGIVSLWRRGRHGDAAIAGVLLSAMVVTPPLVGFALFFCAYHSPKHLREAWAELQQPPRRLLLISAGLTGVALLGAGVLTWAQWRGALPASLTAATFTTFAVLTVPHMLAPPLLRWWQRRAGQLADASCSSDPNICGIASASKP